MSANTALVTEAAKQAARDSLNAYAEVVFDHITGGWSKHSALRVYSQAFLDSAGNQAAAQTARLGLTLGTTNYVVAAPIVATGTSVPSGAAPIITVQPSSATVPAGSTASFSVVALSSGAITYQWFKNGAAFSGQISAQLVLLNVQSTDAGAYFVTASNSVGNVTSATVTLTVTAASSGGGSGEFGPGAGVEIP